MFEIGAQMLKYASFHKNKIKIGEGLSYSLPEGEDFIWVFASKLTDLETNKLVADFDLDLNVLKSYTRANHSKRYSTKPFQFVFVDYFLEKEKFMSTKLLFILEKNYLITIAPQHFAYYDELFDNLLKELENCDTKKNINHLLYHFLEEDTEENYDVLANTEALIVSIERKLITNGKHMADVNEIISLKRELFHMTRRFWASAKIIFAIKKGLTPIVLDTGDLNLFDDIYHTFQHQLDIATAQKEMLADSLQIYTATISNQLATMSHSLNKTMKFLTALTVVLMIPTLIASIYGMNFKFIPFAEMTYGFYGIIGFMAVLLIGSLGYFWRKDWL